MAYATPQEIIDAYGRDAIQELTDRDDPPRGEVDDDLLERAIQAAVDLVDGYLAKRYTLPLASVPINLQDHVRALVFFNLHRGRVESVEEDVRKFRDDALAYLRDVERGVILLGGATPPSVTGATAPSHSAPDRVFSDSALSGFAP